MSERSENVGKWDEAVRKSLWEKRKRFLEEMGKVEVGMREAMAAAGMSMREFMGALRERRFVRRLEQVRETVAFVGELEAERKEIWEGMSRGAGEKVPEKKVVKRGKKAAKGGGKTKGKGKKKRECGRGRMTCSEAELRERNERRRKGEHRTSNTEHRTSK